MGEQGGSVNATRSQDEWDGRLDETQSPQLRDYPTRLSRSKFALVPRQPSRRKGWWLGGCWEGWGIGRFIRKLGVRCGFSAAMRRQVGRGGGCYFIYWACSSFANKPQVCLSRWGSYSNREAGKGVRWGEACHEVLRGASSTATTGP